MSGPKLRARRASEKALALIRTKRSRNVRRSSSTTSNASAWTKRSARAVAKAEQRAAKVDASATEANARSAEAKSLELRGHGELGSLKDVAKASVSGAKVLSEKKSCSSSSVKAKARLAEREMP